MHMTYTHKSGQDTYTHMKIKFKKGTIQSYPVSIHHPSEHSLPTTWMEMNPDCQSDMWHFLVLITFSNLHHCCLKTCGSAGITMHHKEP